MPRRILLLITDLEIGGTPTVVRELAIRLHDPPRVIVDVACLSRWGPVADQLQDREIVVTALGARSALDLLRTVARLTQLIRAARHDTVFSFLAHANAVAAIASCLVGGVRWIQSIQTTQARPRWYWRMQALAQYGAERVVAPSQSAARVAQRWAQVPHDKLIVIPNAVDVGEFPRSKIARENPNPYPIGFIGRLDPIKRVDWLIYGLRSIQVPVHLHVFGEGRERPRIEQCVREWGMQDRVTLHGAIARPQDALKQIGLLALPSEAEGFGLVLIEAMAAGVPVVATNVDGVRDVVRDGETGLLVDPASPLALAMAIERVIQDRALRERLIESGLREVRERFGWEHVIAQYRRLLAIQSTRGS